MCDNKQILVIVTHIWQKPSSIERKATLIVTNFWQLFSQIFGETLLLVTHIWRNQTPPIRPADEIYNAKPMKSRYLW
jgi:hypothetical protein